MLPQAEAWRRRPIALKGTASVATCGQDRSSVTTEEGFLERYPLWMVLVSNAVSLAIYLAGAFITCRIGLAWLIAYLAFALFLELRLTGGHCVSCYYYGKTCAFGRGRISGVLFKRRDPSEFCNRQLTWKDLLPDLMISLVPVAIGAVLLVVDFTWAVLSSVVVLLVLTTLGNWFVRGQLACKHCVQRRLGCPAEKLFGKKQ
jgi:hypothetical protein